MTLQKAIEAACRYSKVHNCGGIPSIKSGVCITCNKIFWVATTKSFSQLVRSTYAFCSKRCAGAGNRFVDTHHGYAFVCVLNHPRASKSGYIPEHVLVMETHLGRYLKPGENIHHKNGIRDDNRIENLELWTSYQPSGQRVEDLIDFVVRSYPKKTKVALKNLYK